MVNYRMRYHDSIEFWAVSYKWRVNIGSLANEMLREQDEVDKLLVGTG